MCAASEIGALSRAGMAAFEHGDSANAEFLLFQAVRKAEAKQLHGFLAKLHNNLGLVLLLNGSARRAASHFSISVRLLEERRLHSSRLYGVVSRHLEQALARG